MKRSRCVTKSSAAARTLQQTIEKMFAELSNVKTDRNLLAGLFVEVAKCLNQDMGPKNAAKGAAEPLRSWSAGLIRRSR